MFGQLPQSSWRRCALRVAFFLAWGAWSASSLCGLPGQAMAADGAPAKEASPADPQAAAAKAKEAGELYTVPETKSIVELVRFIQRVQNYQPESAEDELEHEKKAPAAIKIAAERILKLEPDKNSQSYKQASRILLAIRAQTLDEASPAEQKAVADEIVKRISKSDPDRQDLALALMMARQFERLADSKIAAGYYAAVAKVLTGSGDKELIELGESMAGAVRRLELVGKPPKVEGEPMEGRKFDWASYRGKVVFIDFWATWCGPCRRELPNLKQAYREYHDRGFDVVGISIDDSGEELEHFLTDQKLPWVTLRDIAPGSEEGHPLAEYYGITGIPSTILVGKDGNVVALGVRGEELWVQLAKLIGPPQDAADDSDAAEEHAKPETKAAAQPPAKAKPSTR